MQQIKVYSAYLSSIPGKRISASALGLVLSAHALAFWALSTQRHSMPTPAEHPIMVSLVVPEPKPEPQTLPPKVLPPKIIKPAHKPIPQKVNAPPPPQEVVTEFERQLSVPAIATNSAPTATPSPQIMEEEISPQVTGVPNDIRVAEDSVTEPSLHADYLNNPAPVYPRQSRQLREEGRVLLRVLVDIQGNPTKITLHSSSGHARLDERAMETVRRWKFVPAHQGGKAIDAWVIIPIQFSLKG